MIVYRYKGIIKEREEYRETGTVVATSNEEALRKLGERGLESIRLRRLRGLSALIKRFRADVK